MSGKFITIQGPAPGCDSEVLWICGSSENPRDLNSMPGTLVIETDWAPYALAGTSQDLLADNMTKAVDELAVYLSERRKKVKLVIAHSLGSNLLLLAFLRRFAARREALIPSVLLSAKLGHSAAYPQISKNIDSIRLALGFPRLRYEMTTGVGRELEWESWANRDRWFWGQVAEKVLWIHGARDPQCPVQPLRKLRERGSMVAVLEDDHKFQGRPDDLRYVIETLARRLRGRGLEMRKAYKAALAR